MAAVWGAEEPEENPVAGAGVDGAAFVVAAVDLIGTAGAVPNPTAAGGAEAGAVRPKDAPPKVDGVG